MSLTFVAATVQETVNASVRQLLLIQEVAVELVSVLTGGVLPFVVSTHYENHRIIGHFYKCSREGREGTF